VRTKQRKKLASRTRVPLAVAVRPNQRWSMDFIQEQTEDGRSSKHSRFSTRETALSMRARVSARPLLLNGLLKALDVAAQSDDCKPQAQ
jgi:hypothetical protein